MCQHACKGLLNATIGTGGLYKKLNFVIFLKSIFEISNCPITKISFICNVFVVGRTYLWPSVDEIKVVKIYGGQPV